MSMEDFIITVYCLIDDLLKKQLGNDKLIKRGFNPALSDSEIIKMVFRFDARNGSYFGRDP